MKTLLTLVFAAILLIGAYFVMMPSSEPAPTVATSTPQTTVKVTPIGHATALLEWEGSAIYTDPTQATSSFAGKPAANIVLVTDIHGDHFSTSTLASLVGSTTALIVPQAVFDLLPSNLKAKAKILSNGEILTEQGFAILAIPMYNLPVATSSPHIKGRGNGYVIEKDGFRTYVAGDTSGIPEMRALSGIDLALIPMNLPYTMSVEEAADAVLAFKPGQVYPYHYRGQDGLSDVNKFKQLVNTGNPSIDVVLADWYPQQ